MNRATKVTTTASLLMIALTSGAYAAQEEGRFILKTKIQGDSEVPEWTAINYLYEPWQNKGAYYSCSTWLPDVTTVDWGRSFQQSRNCSQDQTRTATPVLFNPVLQTTKKGESFEEQRTITVSQYQPAIGKRDYIDGESAKAWSAWTDVGGHYDCTAWTPETDTVNLYDNFTQDRDCQQDQTRSRDVYHVWASGKETPKRVDTEDKTITEQEQRTTQGTKDYIYGERIGSWTSWADTGTPYNCTAWTPTPDTINLDQSYTQTRDCQQDQDSERNIYDVWRSGKETLNRVEPRAQTITVEQSRGAVGEKDFIASERIGSWTSWTDEGGHFACGVWSPDVSTVDYGESVTQTRDCSQKQVRERNVYDVWQSGKETLQRVDDQSQTITEQEQQSAVGTRDFITGETAKSWGSWSDEGNYYGCSDWTPTPDTVNLDAAFTQSRTCDQDQTRTRQVNHTWASGKETFKRTETDERTIDDEQSRGATGAKDYNTGSDSAGAWGSWSDNGAVTNCSTWSPSPGTVNLGQSFTQSRTCDQKQTRTRTIYDVWASGEKKASHTETDTRTIDDDQSRSATGTKNYDTGTNSAGSWGDWSDSGSAFNCSEWSPSQETVNLGQSFTQTRSCDQKQTRTRTIYNVWASGETTVSHTETDTRTINDEQNRGATGAKDYDTGSDSAGAWGSWSDSGSVTNCSAWSPSPGTVNLGQSFTQSRTCDQKQTRSRTIYNVWASGEKKASHTETDTRTIDDDQSQGATGTKDYITGTSAGGWSSWSNSGGEYSCSGWSPSTSTVRWGDSFTQSQSCSQNQTRSRTIYNVWKSGKETVKTTESDSQTVSVTNNRTAEGRDDYVVSTTYSAWSGWSTTRSRYSCTSYGPSTGTVNWGQTFTQTRDCQRDQERARTVYENWASGNRTTAGSQTDDRTITITDSRSATGTRDYDTGSNTYGSWSSWSNTGGIYSCDTYGPSTSTVDWGKSFTQSRECQQNQSRSRSVFNVWASGDKKYSHTQDDSRVIDVTTTRGNTGTRDYIVGPSYDSWSSWSTTSTSCSGWSPSPSTVNEGTTFTQTRSCTYNEKRTQKVYDKWASGSRTYSHTKSDTRTTIGDQNRTNTGTKKYITGSSSTQGSWSKSGNAKNCSSYSPSTSTINYGLRFEQSRTCEQKYVRTVTVWDDWSDGSKTESSSYTQSKTDDVTQTRYATGTKDTLVRVSNAYDYEYSSWSCGAWGPSTDEISEGFVFEQTRSCEREEERYSVIYNHYASGRKVEAYRTFDRKSFDYKTESREAVGTKSGCSYWPGTTICRTIH